MAMPLTPVGSTRRRGWCWSGALCALMAMLLWTSAAAAQVTQPATVAFDAPDPVILPLTGGAGAAVGGVAGSAVALGLALAAQAATGEEITDEARTLNQLTTFGTLVAPALLSVAGAVVGAGLSTGLVGALTCGFGATLGAAIGTGAALALVPVGAAAETGVPGGVLGATAAVGGIVVAAAAVGAAVAGVVAAVTLGDQTISEDADEDEDADAFAALTDAARLRLVPTPKIGA